MRPRIRKLKGRKVCERYARRLRSEERSSCENCLFFIHVDGQDFCRLIRNERILKRI